MSINAPEPSYGEGYAPFNGPPENPSLWPAYGWVPPLGVTGRTIKNIVQPGLFDGVFNETARPVWTTSDVPQSSPVLEWDAEDDESYIEVGNIPDFQFDQLKSWTIVASGSVANTANDDRAIVSKYATFAETSQRQMIFQVDGGAAPAHLRIHITSGGSFTSPNGITKLDTWYTWVCKNDGTGAANGLTIQTWSKTGQQLESVSGQHGGNGTLTWPIQIWGRNEGDEYAGLGGPVYFYHGVLPDAAIRQIAQDNLAPVRLAPMPSLVTTGVVSDIDTREKRASVPGVARPYARGKLPTTIDAAWRQATGLTYAGSTIAAPAGGFVPAYAANANTLLGGGLA